MSAGGSVLWLIAILAAFMWAIILERIWYFNAGHKLYMSELKSEWDAVVDHTSWKGGAIKEKLISQARTEVNRHLSLINTCVALAPLFGLLGTVTGMIITFQAITIFGAGDPKAMAGGISSALVTTVLGLLVAIPTVLLHTVVNGRSQRIIHVLNEQATGIVAEHSERAHN